MLELDNVIDQPARGLAARPSVSLESSSSARQPPPGSAVTLRQLPARVGALSTGKEAPDSPHENATDAPRNMSLDPKEQQ
jgi:hypothetical protein